MLPLVGINATQAHRPPEYGGAVELLLARPAPRTFPPRANAGFLLWVEEGAGSVPLYEGRPLAVPGGVLGVSPPGAVWSCRYTEAGFRSIEIAPERLAADLDGALRDPRRLAFPCPVLPDRALAMRFLAAFDTLWRGPERLAREEALVGLLAAVLEHGAGAVTAHDDAAPRALRRARDLLDAVVDARVSLDELARLSGLGKFALLRGFRRAVGVTPYAYHLRVRLAAAKRLLRSGLTGAAVAQATGFSDQSHFARHFARTFGLSPARYARLG